MIKKKEKQNKNKKMIYLCEVFLRGDYLVS